MGWFRKKKRNEEVERRLPDMHDQFALGVDPNHVNDQAVQQAMYSQPEPVGMQQQMQRPESFERRDIDVLMSKLDVIAERLERLNMRLEQVERAVGVYREQQPLRRW